MMPPTYRNEVRWFKGLVTYYCGMWAILPKSLVSLTKITSIKVTFKWTRVKQDVFKETKWIMARGVLLAYPDFNGEFKIHTYANNFQLWLVIIQNRNPITFYCIKLTGSQIMFTIT